MEIEVCGAFLLVFHSFVNFNWYENCLLQHYSIYTTRSMKITFFQDDKHGLLYFGIELSAMINPGIPYSSGKTFSESHL